MILNNISDTLTNIGDSIIQHGKFNDRIYLMKLSKKDFPDILYELDRLALDNKYSKIFAKVPAFAKDEFVNNRYIEEAYIPRFYNGQEDVYFMGKYFSKLRIFESRIKEINEILDIVTSKVKIDTDIDIKLDLRHEFDYIVCNKSHTYQIADIYKKVFETYPFPIYDSEYIAKTMNENFIYFSIQKNGNIVALSSSEMDINSRNVEMTDFTTLPEYRGNGFATYLLYEMENEMINRDMKIAYTISRAISHGINTIFVKMKYKYGGILINNTNISGGLESMNVWYKYL